MDFTQLITSATRNSGLSCPKCTSLSYRRHGKHLGIQRYCCKKCGKTFKETVNTPLHWIHSKQLMPKYIQTMTDQFSLRAAAIALNISHSTSFRWRHRLLSSLTIKSPSIAISPSGIAQIKTPHSFKGKRNIPDKKFPNSRTIIVTDDSGSTSLIHLREKNHAFETSNWLSQATLPNSLLACSQISCIKNAVRASGRKMILFNGQRKSLLAKTETAIRQIQGWMARFRGVATKYLHQYWNWFCSEHSATSDSFAKDCFGQRQLLHYRKILVE